MEIHKEVKNGILIISLGAKKTETGVTGDIELDVDNNYVLTEIIEEELNRGNKNILLEMKNVNYVDSSGLGAIFDSYKQITEKSGAFKILNPTVDVKRVLDITKISKKINIFVNEEEALKSFSS
ncbi:MAG: STAS domain-containing protein [Candidatus Margulisbacteria bacterium]|nr:STAS domain-containing protein [Candidatus Margulisiibacteriota bacterium]